MPFFGRPAFLPGDRLAIGLVNLGNGPSSGERIASVSLTSGKVMFGPKVGGNSAVVASGDDAWAVTTASDGHSMLSTINPRTLALGKGVPLGEICNTAAEGIASEIAFQPTGADAGDAWVCTDAHLSLVVPWRGQVIHSIAVPSGYVGNVVVEPDGRYVDISVMTGSQGIDVLEYSTSNYELAARSTGWLSPGAPGLTAVGGGVWISIRSGMDGTALLLGEGSLARQPDVGYLHVNGDPNDSLPIPGRSVGMGIAVMAGPRLVVLTDPLGVTCVSPTGTKVLDTAFFASTVNASAADSWQPIGSVGHTLYATTFGSESEIAVTVPSAC